MTLLEDGADVNIYDYGGNTPCRDVPIFFLYGLMLTEELAKIKNENQCIYYKNL